MRPSTLNLDDLSKSQDSPRKGELIKEGQDSRNNPKEPKDSNNKATKTILMLLILYIQGHHLRIMMSSIQTKIIKKIGN